MTTEKGVLLIDVGLADHKKVLDEVAFKEVFQQVDLSSKSLCRDCGAVANPGDVVFAGAITRQCRGERHGWVLPRHVEKLTQTAKKRLAIYLVEKAEKGCAMPPRRATAGKCGDVVGDSQEGQQQ